MFAKAEKLVEKFRAKAEALADEVEPAELRELLYYLVDTVLGEAGPAPPARHPVRRTRARDRNPFVRPNPKRGALHVALITTPDFDALYRIFPHDPDKPRVEAVAAEDVPKPYRGLLVHTHHMTITVEGFYGEPVDVRVLESRQDGEEYARKILLTLKDRARSSNSGWCGSTCPSARRPSANPSLPAGRRSAAC